jgi:hypothetical protein
LRIQQIPKLDFVVATGGGGKTSTVVYGDGRHIIPMDKRRQRHLQQPRLLPGKDLPKFNL